MPENERDLAYYASTGDLDKVKTLLKANPKSIDQKDGEGRAAIHYACDRSNLKLVQLLLTYGADVNLQVSLDFVKLMQLCRMEKGKRLCIMQRWLTV